MNLTRYPLWLFALRCSFSHFRRGRGDGSPEAGEPSKTRSAKNSAYSERNPDRARAHRRIHLFDGARPLRSAKELRGSRGQCHRDGILARRSPTYRRGTKVRALLLNYLDKRILLYDTRDPQQLSLSIPKLRSCRPSCGPPGSSGRRAANAASRFGGMLNS